MLLNQAKFVFSFLFGPSRIDYYVPIINSKKKQDFLELKDLTWLATGSRILSIVLVWNTGILQLFRILRSPGCVAAIFR